MPPEESDVTERARETERALLSLRFEHVTGILHEVKEDLKDIANKAAGMETRIAVIETKALMWGALAGLVSSGSVALLVNMLSKKF